MVEAMARRQDRLWLTELALMDIDADHLELIGALIGASDHRLERKFQIIQTIDAQKALSSADFVITTFRIGGMDARVIDERVPLGFGILGQETTGPGGFAIGMRSIPVLVDLVWIVLVLFSAQVIQPNASPLNSLSAS
jgi:6-phospho-beta-glucosidase